MIKCSMNVLRFSLPRRFSSSQAQAVPAIPAPTTAIFVFFYLLFLEAGWLIIA